MTPIDANPPPDHRRQSVSKRSSRPGNEAAARRRRRGTVPADVADYLRRQILTRQLRPGERIDQPRIASELDVSRSPIREAVVLLSQEGLLDLIPNRGAQVVGLFPDDVTDHYRLLAQVVGSAAAQAAERLDESDRAALQQALQVGADLDPAVGDHSRIDVEFQRLILAAAPRRTQWLAGLLAQSMPLDVGPPNEQWDRNAHQLRTEVANAIDRRDSSAARDAAERYVRAAGEHLVAVLRGLGVWDERRADDRDVRQLGRQAGEANP